MFMISEVNRGENNIVSSVFTSAADESRKKAATSDQ